MSEKLLPCPFCGATPHRGLTPVMRDQLHGEPLQHYRIWCPHGCSQITKPNQTLAVEAWNTRAQLSAPADGSGAGEPFGYLLEKSGMNNGYYFHTPAEFAHVEERFRKFYKPVWTRQPADAQIREALEKAYRIVCDRAAGGRMITTKKQASETFTLIEAALAALKSQSDAPETCATCMGSGYSNHPDSGEICAACGGQGEAPVQPSSEENADLNKRVRQIARTGGEEAAEVAKDLYPSSEAGWGKP